MKIIKKGNPYRKHTRMFEFPDGYVAWHLMAQVFGEFLIPLDLVEKISLDGVM